MVTALVLTVGDEDSLLRQPVIHSRQLSRMSMQVIGRIGLPLKICGFTIFI
jgi:hypothetical protein